MTLREATPPGFMQPIGLAAIERFAQEVAAICLEDSKVSTVIVTVDKPAALDEARSAAISIRRTRQK